MLPKGSDVLHQLIYHFSYISSHVYNSILNLSPTPFRPKANKVPMPTILFLNSIEIQCPSGECVKLWTLYQPILAIGHIGAITCLSYIYIYRMDRLFHKTNCATCPASNNLEHD